MNFVVYLSLALIFYTTNPQSLFCSAQSIFGNWDQNSETPSFEWSLNQRIDKRAEWYNSQSSFDGPSTLHWQMFGNKRLNAMATDWGYVNVANFDRGPTWLNQFDSDERNFGGGYSFVSLNSEGSISDCDCSAFQFCANVSGATRNFGVASFETATNTLHNSVRVAHQIVAPFGDQPFLLDQVTLTNLAQKPLSVNHYQFWDLNYQQLWIEWARTAEFTPPGDLFRRELNREFTQRVYFNQTQKALISQLKSKSSNIPPRDSPSETDYYPLDVFLAYLGPDSNLDFSTKVLWTDQNSFFGPKFSVPTDCPGAVLQNSSSDGQGFQGEAFAQAATFVMKSTHLLQPGEHKVLLFAFGYLPTDKPDLARLLAPFRTPNILEHEIAKWKASLMEIDLPPTFPFSASVFERETQWRSYQLQSFSTYREYFQAHTIAQGSVYLYGHGADGAPRDTALFTLPTNFLDISLAKSSIRLLFSLQSCSNGAMFYAFCGSGASSSALGLHAKPSDLDIYLFLAVNYYLSISGDFDFLNETLAFYPKDCTQRPLNVTGDTVMDHLEAAFLHLTQVIGFGSHALLKIGDGDWDDGIIYKSDPDPLAIEFSIQNGESVPNSQMAIYVFHQTSKIFEKISPKLSQQAAGLAKLLEIPVRATFHTKWFGRAWLRNALDQPYLRGTDISGKPENFLTLQAQPWALLSNLLNSSQEQTLFQEIQQQLGSCLGPKQLPSKDALVWPAISQLMTLVYAQKNKSDLGWQLLFNSTYQNHVQQFPAQWMGIMSGPDGWSPSTGFTWESVVTPMTDFPVSNANGDAMFLLGLMHLSGFDISAGGFQIDLRRVLPKMIPYSLKTPVFSVRVTSQEISGSYCNSQNSGSLTLTLVAPNGHIFEQSQTQSLQIPLQFSVSQIVTFSAVWKII